MRRLARAARQLAGFSPHPINARAALAGPARAAWQLAGFSPRPINARAALTGPAGSLPPDAAP